MEPEYSQTSGSGLGMLSILHRADQEIEKLKKSNLNTNSKYWKPINKNREHDTGKVGVKSVSETNLKGTYDDWMKAYAYFCDQKVNTKGQKVNRQRLKEYAKMSKLSFGKRRGN
jgi:hypothetical protein